MKIRPGRAPGAARPGRRSGWQTVATTPQLAQAAQTNPTAEPSRQTMPSSGPTPAASAPRPSPPRRRTSRQRPRHPYPAPETTAPSTPNRRHPAPRAPATTENHSQDARGPCGGGYPRIDPARSPGPPATAVAPRNHPQIGDSPQLDGALRARGRVTGSDGPALRPAGERSSASGPGGARRSRHALMSS
jgi:hypothetical protein